MKLPIFSLHLNDLFKTLEQVDMIRGGCMGR